MDKYILFVSLISVAISLTALTISYSMRSLSRKQYEMNAFSRIESKFIDIESNISESSGILKFHNISEEDLRAIGITVGEFSYLLANFTAGGIRSRAHNETIENVEITDYRLKMLESKSTRSAWPLLKGMMNTSAYRSKVDEIVEKLNRGDKSN